MSVHFFAVLAIASFTIGVFVGGSEWKNTASEWEVAASEWRSTAKMCVEVLESLVP